MIGGEKLIASSLIDAVGVAEAVGDWWMREASCSKRGAGSWMGGCAGRLNEGCGGGVGEYSPGSRRGRK